MCVVFGRPVLVDYGGDAVSRLVRGRLIAGIRLLAAGRFACSRVALGGVERLVSAADRLVKLLQRRWGGTTTCLRADPATSDRTMTKQ